MKTKSNLRMMAAGLTAALCLCATMGLQAQQRIGGGGGGGFGGFGGFGGGAFRNNNSSSSTSGSQYNGNGTVGDAVIQVDPDTGNIVVIADEQTTRNIGEVLQNLDQPKPQVLIKVVFMELTHEDSSDIGIEGGYQKSFGLVNGMPLTNVIGQSFGLTSIGSAISSSTNGNVLNQFGQPIQSFAAIAPYATPGAGIYQLMGNDFQATLRAIAAAGKSQVLARPSIIARDRQQASVVIGESVPLPSGTQVSTLGTLNTSVTYQDVGIILTVTPFINPGGLVEMIVAPQDSSIDPTQSVPIGQGVNAPVIDVTSANTVVTTPDGQTVVIGGLMESDKADNVSKIPFLGDIPLLGNLFKRTVKSSNKNELVIFLTPYIIRTPSQVADLTDKERARDLTPKSYSEEELDKFLDQIPVKKSKH